MVAILTVCLEITLRLRTFVLVKLNSENESTLLKNVDWNIRVGFLNARTDNDRSHRRREMLEALSRVGCEYMGLQPENFHRFGCDDLCIGIQVYTARFRTPLLPPSSA
jgi:hypothetical protein